MAWLALSVIAALVATGLLVAATGNPQKRLFVMGAFATVGVWLVITLFGFTFVTIGAGHLGLVKTFSDYTGVMDPGFNTKAPWQSVDEVNVKIQSKRVIMDGQAGRGSAVSRETQPVYAIVTLNYSIDPTAALELYRSVGRAYYDSIIAPRVAQVFKGYLGDRTSYAGFSYGDLSWQCDASKPVGINPAGCTKNGNSIDGVLPDDQRRGGSFSWPPPHENYVYEALQGALMQAVILKRKGYDVFNWENKALLRAFQWLHNVANFPPEGDDRWESHLINYFYGTNFPAQVPTSPGKNMGWTDWTHP